MVRRCSQLAAGFALIAAVTVTGGHGLWGQTPGPAPSRVAYRITDVSSGRVVASARDDLLRTPILPGSIAKIATLVAALESGVIQPSTRIACPRRLEVEGRRLDCSHPDLGRPLTPAEALAHSCNGYFANVARRLSRASLDRALGQLGLPPSSPRASVTASALGLDGTRLPAEQWLAALVRVTAADERRIPAEAKRVMLDGLSGAAEFGTAVSFHGAGLTAFAKTGTAPMPGGGFEGLLVAVTPADRPTRSIVVMAPGAAGMDAARLAVELLREADPQQVIRVGVALERGGYRVAELPLEEYVSRVVSAEAVPSSGIEAQQALAIVARTFALHNRSRHAREGFDVCDLTHCQVMGSRTKAGDEAARATDGQVLVHRGQPADVYYTASCGGHSERPSQVWPGAADPPYLPARPEPECRGDRWQCEIGAADLRRALGTAGHRGESLRALAVVGRTGSGRVASLRIGGLVPGEISGENLRLAAGRTLGWQLLKSTLFDVERTSIGYRFSGGGRGHGVGLCVAGSARMAAAGQPAASILERYFPGTAVRRAAGLLSAVSTASTRVTVVVPAGEDRERGRIESIAVASLREFSSKLGVAVPGDIRIVAHPTVEAYMRASGQAWWTAGATSERRIDLVPLTGLRNRGVLEPTLRHELAHVVAADRLKTRPIWVQEAVAMDVAGDTRYGNGVPAASVRGSTSADCPTDQEWRSLQSAPELDRAYRRAAVCYAAQRARGVRWDEVR
jgi:SpoIID/LytB domain protein